MKLENQVCSLEHAKRLKELGVKQESLFYWKAFQDKWHLDFCDKPLEEFRDRWCSAFTVAELGEMLPPLSGLDDNSLLIIKNPSNWYVSYWDIAMTGQIEESLSDVLAQMLIYLLENKLIPI